MSFLPLVYEELIASSDVLGFVEDRIYRHGEAPDGVDGEYLTWYVVTGVPENTLAEAPAVDRVSVQIDCWGNNAGTGDEDVELLAQAVRDTIEANHHMEAVVVNGKDPETRRYRIGMVFTWFNRRGEPGQLLPPPDGESQVPTPLQAMFFDGEDRDDLSSRVLVHPPGITPTTVDGSLRYKIKVKRERTGVTEVLIGVDSDVSLPTNTVFNVLYIDGNDHLVMFLATTSGNVGAFGTTALQAGVEYTLEGEWTGSQIRVLVNGVQEGTTPAAVDVLAYDDATPLAIGAVSPNAQVTPGISPYAFRGILADAELWIGGVRVGYWPLAKVTYNATPDESGNGLHGILIGTVKPSLVDSPFV